MAWANAVDPCPTRLWKVTGLVCVGRCGDDSKRHDCYRPQSLRVGLFLRLALAVQIRVVLRRSAFPTTLTDDSAIAAAATIGDSSSPNVGYSTPAAIGIPAAL